MPRFSHTVIAGASIEDAWETLQDAGVWGSLLGAAEVGDISVEAGLLQGASWTAKIGGTTLTGTMTVEKATPVDYMDVMVRTSEWRCRIEMVLAEQESDEPATEVHSRVHLSADGLTAMLALPIVSNVIGKYFPDRMRDLAELMAE